MAVEENRLMRPIVTSEEPGAPTLLSLYDTAGLVARAELSPESALRLALELLCSAVPKAAAVLRVARDA